VLPCRAGLLQVCVKLRDIMQNIYNAAKGAADEYGSTLAAGRRWYCRLVACAVAGVSDQVASVLGQVGHATHAVHATSGFLGGTMHDASNCRRSLSIISALAPRHLLAQL